MESGIVLMRCFIGYRCHEFQRGAQMDNQSKEYQQGYAQGVIDFSKRLEKYYNALKGRTSPTLTAYHIDQIKQEMLKAYREFDPHWLDQDGK
jgi:hypothetical protein